MSLVNDIKSKAQADASGKKGAQKEENAYSGTATLLIESSLNKLFYVKPNYPEELRMLKMQKMQAQQQGDRYGLHCSAIIASEKEFCYRQQVLSLFFKQEQGENIPIGRKRVYAEGTAIGEKWQRLFVSGGIGLKENMDMSRFADKYDLSYTPDAIITLNGDDWVVEIKSKNTFQFKKDNSHPSGRKQLRMYEWFARIKKGFVLVEDKNDQNFKIFPEIYGETWTKDDILPYLERLEAIQSYKRDFIENKKMVGRKEGCTSPTCKQASECSMKDACFNVGMGRIRLEGK